MSSYTSGNNAPTQMAQAPNRKGNVSKHLPSKTGGATAVTRPSGGTFVATPNQGAAKANGNIATRGQKMALTQPKPYCTYAENTAYMNSDRTNYLK
jgi:hypothetical protein